MQTASRGKFALAKFASRVLVSFKHFFRLFFYLDGCFTEDVSKGDESFFKERPLAEFVGLPSIAVFDPAESAVPPVVYALLVNGEEGHEVCHLKKGIVLLLIAKWLHKKCVKNVTCSK